MARLPTKIKPGQKITPLTIVASFLGITEIVLGYAVGHVTGGVQVALAVFVMIFTLAVAAAFFAILWYRPWVFYSPSEYGDVDPQQFMSAIRQPTVNEQVELVKSVEANPDDLDAKFALIDAMADQGECQWVILMHETGKDGRKGSSHVYSYGGGMAGSGHFGFWGRNSLEGTGMLRQGGGNHMTLTEEGHQFAQWLIRKGRKCEFFWTPMGGWGTAAPSSIEDQWVQQIVERIRNPQLTPVTIVPPTPPTGGTALPSDAAG